MNLFRWRERKDEELDAEIQNHLDEAMRDRIERGETPEQARLNVRREFGNVGLVKEVTREMWGWTSLERLMQDLRFGARMLLKQPGFTLIATLTLALGIGANTAIFSVIDAALFHPLPFDDSERLVELNDGVGYLFNLTPEVNGGEFMSWREPVDLFESVAAYDTGRANLSDEHSPERIQILQSTPSFFTVLRARPALGRLFNDDELRRGESRLLILSDGLWRRRFGGDENVIGRVARLNGESLTIIGVMPSWFDYQVHGQKPEAFIPLLPSDELLAKEAYFYTVIGRLKEGVTQARARAELNAIGERLTQARRTEAAQNPEKRFDGRVEIGLRPLIELFVGDLRRPLLALLGAVAGVLLIACVNVANLMVARAATRQKEIAVRAALGASRWRLMRQWLAESMLLALAGGAAGLLMSVWIIDALTAIYPEPLAKLGAPGIDGRAVLFTSAVTLLTGVLFGGAPALQFSRPDLTTAMKEGGGLSGGGAPRLRKILLVGEVALTLALLIGAGLLVKSFWRTLELRAGFRAEGVLTLELSPAPGKYADSAQRSALYRQILERVAAAPGVQTAGAGNHLPLSITGGAMLMPLKVIGRGDFDWTIGGIYHIASEDYFRALNIPLRAGRFFDKRDTAQSPKVVILNESLARRAFPNEDPIGKFVTFRSVKNSEYEIVGVVGDSDFTGMGGNRGQEFYLPLQQRSPGALRLAIRTSVEPSSLTDAVREAVRQCDSDLPIYNVKTMAQIVAEASAQRRFAMLSMGAFALVALLLSSLGIYGVMSYIVAQRTHEIGVRMALGAQSRDALKLIIKQGMILVLIGIPIGIACAVALAMLLMGLLYGVSPIDPLTFTMVTALLASVALLACYVPARRAAKVDPMIALRRE